MGRGVDTILMRPSVSSESRVWDRDRESCRDTTGGSSWDDEVERVFEGLASVSMNDEGAWPLLRDEIESEKDRIETRLSEEEEEVEEE